jgi:hypothetical protein
MDIRAEVKKILENYGHYVLYLRRDLRLKCDCYQENAETADPNCPLCFGTGYKVSIEKILARRQSSSNNSTVPNNLLNQSAGKFYNNPMIYYLPYQVNPKNGDLIIEVKWMNQKATGIKEKHFITNVQDKRGINGSVMFFQVYCQNEPRGVNDNARISKD